MDKYTIIIPGQNKPNITYRTFDEVLAKSKQLCKDEICHIIKDNEFGVSVRMAKSDSSGKGSDIR